MQTDLLPQKKIPRQYFTAGLLTYDFANYTLQLLSAKYKLPPSHSVSGTMACRQPKTIVALTSNTVMAVVSDSDRLPY
jgi:hypothetical protein